MRFIVDAQLPPILARWLTSRGHPSDHLSDLDMQAASDRVVWDLALQTSAGIITKDEDFAQRKVIEDSGPVIIWIRIPNTRRNALLTWFEAALPQILTALDRGETFIELI